MSEMRIVTVATIGGALIFGMTLALLGRLKLALAERTHSDDRRIRQFLLALNVTLIPLVVLSGLLIDAFGVRLILILGSVALAVALFGLSAWPIYPHAFAFILLAGFGSSALGAAATVSMPRAFFPPEESSASLNLGYVFVALGALWTPLLADVLLERLELRRTLALLAMLSLTPAFLGLLPTGGQWTSLDSLGERGTVFAEPANWLACLALFFYAPLEASISLWTFTLLAERGQDFRRATTVLAGFWGAFVASRLLFAAGQHVDVLSSAWDRWWIVVPPLLAAVLIGNLAGAGPQGRTNVGLILLGLLLGPMLPTLLALVFRRVEPAEHGLAYGLTFAAGSLGSLSLAPILTYRTRPPFLTALRVPILLALLVTAAALVLGLMA